MRHYYMRHCRARYNFQNKRKKADVPMLVFTPEGISMYDPQSKRTAYLDQIYQPIAS